MMSTDLQPAVQPAASSAPVESRAPSPPPAVAAAANTLACALRYHSPQLDLLRQLQLVLSHYHEIAAAHASAAVASSGDPLAQTDLDYRTLETLESHGITTCGQALECHDLQGLNNLGPKSAERIRAAADRYLSGDYDRSAASPRTKSLARDLAALVKEHEE